MDFFGKISGFVYFFALGMVLLLVLFVLNGTIGDNGLMMIQKNDVSRIADMIKDEADKSGELSESKARELIDYQLARRNGRTARTDKKNGTYRYQFEIISPMDKYTYGSTGVFKLSVEQPRFSSFQGKNIIISETRTTVNRGYFGEGYKEK